MRVANFSDVHPELRRVTLASGMYADKTARVLT